MDVSDGLVADVGRIAAASGVRVVLSAEDLPVADPVAAAAADLGVDPRVFSATGGEDHAVLATLPSDGSAQVMYLLATANHTPDLAEVGRVEAAGPDGPGVVWVDGPPPGLGAAGFDHFPSGAGS